jgi:predicted Rossmann-fold nucleotide-binding protein
MSAKTDTNYEPPKAEVMQVVTEGVIAQSIEFTGTLPDWEEDKTPNNQYDGDIWVAF